MEPLPDGGFLVFVAGVWPVDRVIALREQARSHRVGADPSEASLLSNASHNPDFNRLNARINARLKALPLSFLLYNEARTSAGG